MPTLQRRAGAQKAPMLEREKLKENENKWRGRRAVRRFCAHFWTLRAPKLRARERRHSPFRSARCSDDRLRRHRTLRRRRRDTNRCEKDKVLFH